MNNTLLNLETKLYEYGTKYVLTYDEIFDQYKLTSAINANRSLDYTLNKNIFSYLGQDPDNDTHNSRLFNKNEMYILENLTDKSIAVIMNYKETTDTDMTPDSSLNYYKYRVMNTQNTYAYITIPTWSNSLYITDNLDINKYEVPQEGTNI